MKTAIDYAIPFLDLAVCENMCHKVFKRSDIIKHFVLWIAPFLETV